MGFFEVQQIFLRNHFTEQIKKCCSVSVAIINLCQFKSLKCSQPIHRQLLFTNQGGIAGWRGVANSRPNAPGRRTIYCELHQKLRSTDSQKCLNYRKTNTRHYAANVEKFHKKVERTRQRKYNNEKKPSY